MAEGDNLVDHPLYLKLLCLSQLHHLKDQRSDNQSEFKLKNNIGEGMKMFWKFLTFCLMTLFWQMY
jgi:hypothetical protein